MKLKNKEDCGSTINTKSKLIEALGSNVNDEPAPLATPVPTPLPASSSMLKNIYDKTKSEVSTVYDTTKSAVSTAYDKIKSTARTFVDWIISYLKHQRGL